jgi:3-hydroxymyristoyl/3-hydroxydecanoyl-(acyl carrier protein) dehydratase
MGLNNVKFRKPVLPGDTVTYKVKIISFNGTRAKMQGEVSVDGKVASEAEMTAMLMPRKTDEG